MRLIISLLSCAALLLAPMVSANPLIVLAGSPPVVVVDGHTFDNAARFTAATSPTTSTFTCGSGATVLVLGLVVLGATNRAGTAPTYNGVAMTQAGTVQKAATTPETNVEMWYLIAPPTGAAHTISIPNTGSLTLYAQLSSYKAGTGYTSALDVAGGANGTSTNPTASVTTTANGDVIVASVGSGAQTWAPSARTGTQLSDTDTGNQGDGHQYLLQTTAGSTPMSWTFATSEDWAVCVAAFKRVATGGGGSGTDPSLVANRVIHVIGNDLTGADGDAVATWPAASGTSNAATSFLGGPVKKTNIANGHSVARFSGQYVTFPDNAITALTAGTGYIVVKIAVDPPATEATTGLWSRFGGVADDTVFPYTNGVIYDHFGTTARKETVNPAASLATEFRVYAVSSASGAWANYLDGGLLYSTSSNSTQFPNFPRIGVNENLTWFLAGDVAEFVMYSDAHDATTVGAISTFLKTKYQP